VRKIGISLHLGDDRKPCRTYRHDQIAVGRGTYSLDDSLQND